MAASRVAIQMVKMFHYGPVVCMIVFRCLDCMSVRMARIIGES